MNRVQSVLVACALLAGSATGATAATVWTTVVGQHTQQAPVQIGEIAGAPGSRIVIDILGIGGDSDFDSGWNVFRIVGGGLDFTWGTGTPDFPANPLPTYALPSTPVLGVHARGFSYADVSLTAAVGQSLTVYWLSHVDYDLHYTKAYDLFGNYYDDTVLWSSIRPWVAYDVTPVPLPAAFPLFGAALAAMGVFRWWRRRAAVAA
jgi:hypothetical protein